MRRSLVIMAMLAAVLGPVGQSATAHSAVRAQQHLFAGVDAVSCALAGDCAAGGHYRDPGRAAHPFVVTEFKGRWSAATDVPGLDALKPRAATINSVSCAPGGCVAGGYYLDAARRYHAFVTAEKNGRWSRPVSVLTGQKKATEPTQIGSLSCSGPGNCAAAGGEPAFVVSEIKGRWGKPRQLGMATRGKIRISCASAGNCTVAAGKFVVGERKGRWGKLTPLPGLSALGTKPALESVSCTAAGNCAVGGTYTGHHSGKEVFVASERNGRWGKPIELPGFTALNKEDFSDLSSVSCISAGNCVAGGSYTVPADFAGGVFAPFVASEQNGHWGKAIEVPGIPPADSGECEPDLGSDCIEGHVASVSCGPAGTCAAGGVYDAPDVNAIVAFVLLYQHGHWTHVTQPPGFAALDTGKSSEVSSVSCTAGGKCVAGGGYANGHTSLPAFVADEENGDWDAAHTITF